jgi:apolipoprotein N-acyltransferase
MRLKLNLVFLSIFSALLLSLAWYWQLSIVIFFAFVPLLLLEDAISNAEQMTKKNLKLWSYSYLTFFIWNVLVTWWVVYASFSGACMAFFANSLLMSCVFLIFSSIKKRIAKPWVIWTFIPIWIAWEHIHTLWDISWTWLTLGNVFAFNHNWVQWYEFTGTSGGTLWILAVNILIFTILKNNTSLKLLSKPVLKIGVSIIIPILISYTIFMVRTPLYKTAKKINTLVVQPNIDPYNDKFNSDYQLQFFKLDILKNKIKPTTDYLVLPETFIVDYLDEQSINQSQQIQWFRDSLINKFPKLKIIAGANTFKNYANEAEATSTARKDNPDALYYDVYNTALQIDKNQVEIYHKSKLVPGVEKMPFPFLLKPLEKFAINLGGTIGSLGTQESRTNLTDAAHLINIAPVVCYESVYADFVTEYIRKNANVIFIITNDGWWDNTPGYIHHLNYARLRAIENRRQIARSANTGISCFIDEFGTVSNATKWWEEAVIEKDVYLNNDLTFFSRFGDLISYASVTIASLLILMALFLKIKK